MMRPHLLASSPASARRVVWNADDRLIARIASHFATGKSSIGATCWMPALLTRMSSRPRPRAFCSIIAAIASRFDMSAAECTARTLKSRTRSTVVLAMSSGLPKPLSTIAAPCAASARAMPRPMPLVEPVTSATLPSSERDASIVRDGVAMFMAASQGRAFRPANCRIRPRGGNADWLPSRYEGAIEKGSGRATQRRLFFAPCGRVVHAGARQAGDQPRAALEGQVVPGPVQSRRRGGCGSRSGSRCARRTTAARRRSPSA